MEIVFHSHANKTHFHKKGCAPSLSLKVTVFGTRKWPITLMHQVDNQTLLPMVLYCAFKQNIHVSPSIHPQEAKTKCFQS